MCELCWTAPSRRPRAPGDIWEKLQHCSQNFTPVSGCSCKCGMPFRRISLMETLHSPPEGLCCQDPGGRSQVSFDSHQREAHGRPWTVTWELHRMMG